MKSFICTAVAALLMAAPAWAHDDHTHTHPDEEAKTRAAQPSASVTLNAHTQEDVQRHRAIARAHEQAAQCLEQGGKYDDCQKQLQTSCKGLALGKNCGMRHSH